MVKLLQNVQERPVQILRRFDLEDRTAGDRRQILQKHGLGPTHRNAAMLLGTRHRPNGAGMMFELQNWSSSLTSAGALTGTFDIVAPDVTAELRLTVTVPLLTG